MPSQLSCSEERDLDGVRKRALSLQSTVGSDYSLVIQILQDIFIVLCDIQSINRMLHVNLPHRQRPPCKAPQKKVAKFVQGAAEVKEQSLLACGSWQIGE